MAQCSAALARPSVAAVQDRHQRQALSAQRVGSVRGTSSSRAGQRHSSGSTRTLHQSRRIAAEGTVGANGATSTATPSPPDAPELGAAGLPNRFWEWRGQRIRYQVAGPEKEGGRAVVLVHGLFVNADHWRNNIAALADEHGLRVYAIDLLGNGYSSKPPPTGPEAQAVNGENGRDLTPPRARLGTAGGGTRDDVEVQLSHPLGSVYNFYTWANQVSDFAAEVVKADKVALVCNSIGTITGFQAALDNPDVFDGVMVVNPNFRELHTAEVPSIALPAIRTVQRLLRENGQPLFDSLAKPSTVKQILKEPYHDPEDVTDDLVDALLSPLLTEGSADVVFDNLSYSAGPLPEQQLGDPRMKAKVWVCYGVKDPWTPGKRVDALKSLGPVERVIPLPDVGHCPHDEAPELVNPLVAEFVKSLDS